MSDANESQVLCGSSLGKLLIYDIEKEQVLSKHNEAHMQLSDASQVKFDINSVCYTENSNVFASAGDDSLIKLWDKRCFDKNSSPISGFIGHHEGIVFLDYKRNLPQICSNSKD
jgi:WD40 repeat protein